MAIKWQQQLDDEKRASREQEAAYQEEIEKLRKAGKTAQVRMHTAPSAVGRPTALLLLCSCAIV